MATRLLLTEARRYAAAAARPACALLTLGVVHLITASVLAARPTSPPSPDDPPLELIEVVTTAWLLAALAMLVWLAGSLVRAAREPANDAEAADHLQSLRDRAIIEGHTLVEIHRTLWATQAGQQALSVSITGQVAEIWLPEIRLPDGCFALINAGGAQVSIVGWAPVGQVAAARRHQHRVALRHLPPAGHERRVAHAAKANLVAEAERTVRTNQQPFQELQAPQDPQR